METISQRGKLKIFFGYAPGSGKIRAMLSAAQLAQKDGVDVVVGYISPDLLSGSEDLMEGLEVLPCRTGSDHVTPVEEFDLDAALTRSPQLLLIEDLSHINMRGCRHMRRYQDVAELLRAGIHVYTTLNVQHLESLNDQMASITGTAVTSRIPDWIFDRADQVEFVDAEPEDLRKFLPPENSEPERPPTPFPTYTETQLRALREIALRRTADRLGRSPSESPGVKVGEHILICISSSPSNPRVIRTAARMSEAFHGDFSAVFVEAPKGSPSENTDLKQLQEHLRLAEEMGARIITLYGEDPAVQIAEYARISGVTKIVLGRSLQKKRFFSRHPSLMDRLSTLAPDLDIYIIPDQMGLVPHQHRRSLLAKEHFSWRDTLRTMGILTLCTIIGYGLDSIGFTNANVIMVYFLGVLCISMVTSGQIYSLLASVLSVLIFNFFFTYPYFSLMSDPSYFTTFAVMLVVGLLSSSLTTQIKRQAIQSARKAYRTEVLLETNQQLQKAENKDEIIYVAATQLNKLLDRAVIVYPAQEDGTLGSPAFFPLSGEDLSHCLTAKEQETVEWVFRNNKHAGATTGTFPRAQCLYMAMRGKNEALAVVGILINPNQKPDALEKNIMVALLDEAGLALEKESLRQAKQQIEETAKQETLRANLLRAISHDLRTPLTSISGNAGILMENGCALGEPKKKELYTSIYDDAMWLVNLVENLLSVTRFENGTMGLRMEPELLEEVFQESLSHLDRRYTEYPISMELEDDFLMAEMDARLIVQVVINLVNNSIKHTPSGTAIKVSARRKNDTVLCCVSDNGPGIPDEAKGHLFDMFYTADNTRGDGRRGMGLGLSLCRSIINAHNGTIWVEDSIPHGASFFFTLKASEVNTHE